MGMLGENKILYLIQTEPPPLLLTTSCPSIVGATLVVALDPCGRPGVWGDASALQKQYSRNSSCTYPNMQRPILLTTPKKLLLWLLLQVCHKSSGSSNARS